MNEQIISYAQSYLSTIMNINILLATATAFLLWNAPNKSFKFTFFIPLLLYAIAITFILYSHESLFDLLLEFTPDKNINVKAPFKILDCVFWLDLAGLYLTVVTFFTLIVKDKQ
ncbi:MAG: hypothetical protein A3E85_03800 [Gammaproteobacteria bacterium RIFCSPHIGHO2_12_FULL_45_12]|nr:MAG: hypothetical protein A3E85_03800 [Gammaproteobacteria bacterium RIFCSPHIGHO2_12_FULL_45_12]